MIKKYELVDESGRKRLRALRNFSVQGRDVNVHDLGGYVYDEKTLSQDGNCWIFSGSLEYPGVHVMDEAIVDMGINLASPVTARPKSVVISGNSRIMGPIQFTGFEITSQAGIVWEQGGYTATAGMIPVKASIGSRIRIAAALFGGSVGKVAITSASYEARIISIGSDGLVTSGGTWTAGGPAVTLTTTSPNFLVEVRKTPSGAISPEDVTTAGVTVTTASETSLEIANSSIITLYNGAIADATNILNFRTSDGKSTVQNSSIRIEAVAASSNTLRFLADFDKVNAIFAPGVGVNTVINGIYIRSNVAAPGNLASTEFTKSRVFVVKDCPEFVWGITTFPFIADFRDSGKVFTFNRCTMPVGSAIIHYDDNVTVWDNIDFRLATADLGEALPAQPTVALVSSNKQGWYRIYGTSSRSHGALVESLSSISSAIFSTTKSTYDTIIHKDCTISGLLALSGRCVFGGTQGGASRITNTTATATATAMVVDGNFRIDGNAQVTDTPLKGTGYIGGNAELKNGKVEGYIYMDGNAKYIPEEVENPSILKHAVMRDNSKVTRQRNSVNNYVSIRLYDNAAINSLVSTNTGTLIMRGNSYTYHAGTSLTPIVYGTLEMEDNAKIDGAAVSVYGDFKLVGGFNASSGSISLYGKRTIANVSEITAVELPPTKATW